MPRVASRSGPDAQKNACGEPPPVAIVRVRVATPYDAPAWHALWKEYGRTASRDFTDAHTNSVWQHICEPSEPLKSLIATDAAGVPVGFAGFHVHYDACNDGLACHLDDLYVHPLARQSGIATRLIDTLLEMGRSKEWVKVYWVALRTNVPARRLYETRFVGPDGYIRYTIFLAGPVKHSVADSTSAITRPPELMPAASPVAAVEP